MNAPQHFNQIKQFPTCYNEGEGQLALQQGRWKIFNPKARQE